MEFKLYLDKWRCGQSGAPKSKMGHGDTYLLNSEGYQCCLGQWLEQCGVSHRSIKHRSAPEDVVSLRSKLRKLKELWLLGGSKYNNDFIDTCILINDNDSNTPKQKIRLLETQLKKYGHTLKVVECSKK